jgi:hypothetical protein
MSAMVRVLPLSISEGFPGWGFSRRASRRICRSWQRPTNGAGRHQIHHCYQGDSHMRQRQLPWVISLASLATCLSEILRLLAFLPSSHLVARSGVTVILSTTDNCSSFHLAAVSMFTLSLLSLSFLKNLWYALPWREHIHGPWPTLSHALRQRIVSMFRLVMGMACLALRITAVENWFL